MLTVILFWITPWFMSGAAYFVLRVMVIRIVSGFGG
jgi:hypothetical protein